MRLVENNLQPFDISTTDMPFFDDMIKKPEYFKERKKLTFEIKQMSPAEYIERAASGFRSGGSLSTAADLRNQRVPDIYNKYAKLMQQGTKFPMPVLDYSRGVFSQEGLHRAMAAELAGVEKMPVMIVRTVLDREAVREYIELLKKKWEPKEESMKESELIFDDEQTVVQHASKAEGKIRGYVTDSYDERIYNYFVIQHGVSEHTIEDIQLQYDTVAVLEYFHIQKEYRGQGHGTELFEDFMINALDKGAEAILLIAKSEEEVPFDLEGWYHSWGFEKKAQTKDGAFMVYAGAH